MKTFEFGINKILTTDGYNEVNVAETNFSYEILDRETSGSFDDKFIVLVTVNATGESIKTEIYADSNIYLNELDDIIWEYIADYYVTETE